MSRWTAPREAILELLSRTSKHMSAKDIYSALARIDMCIGLTTIYRTLDLLHRMAIINKVVLRDGEAKYQMKSEGPRGHHHHLICSNCGRIIDYSEFEREELNFIRKTEVLLSKKYRFAIHDHNIDFFGICEQCQELKRKEEENP